MYSIYAVGEMLRGTQTYTCTACTYMCIHFSSNRCAIILRLLTKVKSARLVENIVHVSPRSSSQRLVMKLK